MGLATFLPANFGAEPCTGSNRLTRPGWMLPEAAIPSPPCSAAPMSVTMSPNMFEVTITSNWDGFFTICMARLSA